MSSLSRRRLLASAAGGLVAAMTAACGDDDAASGQVIDLSRGTVPPDGLAVPRQWTRGERPFAVLVGDSLTVGAAHELDEFAEDAGIDLVIDAEVGRRIVDGSGPSAGVTAVERVLDEHDQPDVWVVALGTNDVGNADPPGAYRELVDEMLAAIGSGRPVAWIDVWIAADEEGSRRFNEVLRQSLIDHGEATIGEWTSVAGDEGVLSDGVHPSDDGRRLFVEVVADQLQTWLS